MNKLTQKRLDKQDKKNLNDALMTSIAGISAAIKNTGEEDRNFLCIRSWYN